MDSFKDMRIPRILLGVLCAAVGILLPYFLYVTSGDGDFRAWGLLAALGIAACVSLAVFCACRIYLRTRRAQILIGTAGSYAAFLALVCASAVVEGNWAGTLMWLPIIAIFGLLYMSPLVALCCVGSFLVVADSK